MGHPKKAMPAHSEVLVDSQWKKNHSNAIYLERIIDLKQKTENTS